ncbi:MAG TPA: OB-fold domain-containing protein [Spongiibacteraceae bacterium]|jgi:uncharacterized OB-fold protein|nr:OB-fold domain-containing protein [Spongiibacteraceae bacterium]HUH37233.1 OB-fold domain-containing protein [Spongiibacteraceae bacterium]
MIETIPLPVTDNPVDAPYWAGARRGELLLQCCAGCGRHRFPPRPRCPDCHSDQSRWGAVSGRGEVWSFVVPRPPLLPVFERQSPYVVAVVSLADHPGIRMVGALVEAAAGGGTVPAAVDSDAVRIGAPVQAVFTPLTEDVHLLRWCLLPD